MGKRTRNIYFTSDWHIGHANVLIFDNRPFKDLDHMHESLIKRFNANVRDQDVCYFLGDMGFGNEQTKKVIDRLNGTKILIRGNHDRKQQAMMNCGFDAVIDSASMHIQNERVTLSHCPLRGVFREDVTSMRKFVEGELWHGESRNQEFSVENKGQFHLHGHIHSPNGGISTRISGRQMDVGVPGNNYIPVSISQIESWIHLTKRNEKEDSIRRSGLSKAERKVKANESLNKLLKERGLGTE